MDQDAAMLCGKEIARRSAGFLIHINNARHLWSDPWAMSDLGGL
jgi:hypothetical protein